MEHFSLNCNALKNGSKKGIANVYIIFKNKMLQFPYTIFSLIFTGKNRRIFQKS